MLFRILLGDFINNIRQQYKRAFFQKRYDCIIDRSARLVIEEGGDLTLSKGA